MNTNYQENILDQITLNPNPKLDVCRYQRRNETFQSNQIHVAGEFFTFVESGNLIAQVDGEEITLDPGDTIWIRPGSTRVYANQNPNGARFYNLLITHPNPSPQIGILPTTIFKNSWEVQHYFQELTDLYLHNHPHHEIRLKSLTNLLFSSLAYMKTNPVQESNRFSRVQRTKLNNYIANKIAEDISPRQLADVLNMSLDYFSRLFRTTYGKAPRYYLVEERLRQSSILLRETSMSVKEVAKQLGVQNMGLFCRQFKQQYSCTPSQYRQREPFLTPLN